MNTTKNKDSSKYKCDICKDTGVVLNPDTGSAKMCVCQEIERYKKILQNCGISETFRKKTFENYEVVNNTSKLFKTIAERYINNFDVNNCTSIAFLGQSGIGKTHLSIAIANRLMEEKIPVLYMPYVSKITELKNLNRYGDCTDDFNIKLSKYKSVKVLMIDDLFKAASNNQEQINKTDIRIMFDILNDRCLKGLPCIISSEYDLFTLAQIDQAISGRIAEMCGDNIAMAKKNLKDNYRLRKFVK